MFPRPQCFAIGTCSHDKKRTGPGRKSNAEHAIAFYEYMLAHDDEDDESENREEKEEEEEDEKANDEEDDGTGEKEEESLQSMDSQEFLNQHNDLCDVCNIGGELLCCSTCNLVFHLECVRPVLKELPPGT